MSEQDMTEQGEAPETPEEDVDGGLPEDAEREPEPPDLSVVFGELDEGQRAAVQEQLDAAGARLTELAATLGERSGRTWETAGVGVEVYESGQAMVTGVVKDAAEGITFSIELRPRNFFADDRPWRPGEAPRAMSTDAWDVEGEALVMKVTRVSGRKYTIQESAADLEEQRHDTPEAAAAALASYAEQLAELALSRDPVAASWQSDVDEIGAPPDEDGGMPGSDSDD
jgi:hypothetical protein